MAIILISTVFILGYIAIVFEHSLRLNKAASALITGVICWTIYILQNNLSVPAVSEKLQYHIGETASILFFLLGAMTIVELIDSHNGFEMITQKITTTSKSRLLLMVTVLTFFRLCWII
jgi:Na+/H+ antiporter NhaD/arsenite permease-like protein